MNRSATLAAITGALLLVPTTALAHPALNPNAGPAGTPFESTLVVPHGCAPGGGMPGDDGEASPTVELALQRTAGVTIEPGEVAGWDVEVTDDAIVWSDAGGATTEVIEFPVTLTLSGETGDQLHVRAAQDCASGDSFAWVGTPDDEARWPAVFLAVADEVGNESPATDSMEGMDHDGTATGDDAAAGMDESMDAMDESMDAMGESMDAMGESMDAGDDEGLGAAPVVLGAGIAALLVVAGLALRRRSRDATPVG